MSGAMASAEQLLHFTSHSKPFLSNVDVFRCFATVESPLQIGSGSSPTPWGMNSILIPEARVFHVKPTHLLVCLPPFQAAARVLYGFRIWPSEVSEGAAEPSAHHS